MKVILASRNQGKLREFQALLQGTGLDLRPVSDWPQVGQLREEGQTFLDNARAKAQTVASLTGWPALADDSGLTVEALGGRPGVWSARYAGPGASDEDNYLKLLAELEGVEVSKRRAAFVCVLVLTWPDGWEIAAEGRCQGSISFEPQGERGFGYDPVFFVPGLGRTMAQLDLETKNRISHRAEAAARLKDLLAEAGLADDSEKW
ncbi:MAG: XTP/dITP diphosphatase [Deltaproteobacteria bacterium]|nr:XTP/dITP diphosphatase [Deltaproteobacteria bacterium]